MKRKFLIKNDINSQSIAVLEDDVLVEYLHQGKDELVRGTVVMGLVKEYQSSLDAYFIDTGGYISGFLPGRFLSRKINQGMLIALQVVKPSVKGKGMTLSGVISISGKYCVISSDANKLRVSAKIKDKEEYNRLMDIAKSYLPERLGIIIRTNASDVLAENIIRDIENTAAEHKKIISAQSGPGTVVYRPKGIIDEAMRHFSPGNDIAYFDDMDLFNTYFGQFAVPKKPAPLKFYNKDYDMFDFFSVSNKIKAARGRKVWLKSGGTIVFDYTEAMCVIDVNSSKNTGAGNFKDTAYRTNIEAAAEIAVQIRLRNIGGIIIIDFIDMDKHRNQELDIIFRKYLAKDKRKMAVGGFTALGNYEITRIRKGRRLGFIDEK